MISASLYANSHAGTAVAVTRGYSIQRSFQGRSISRMRGHYIVYGVRRCLRASICRRVSCSGKCFTDSATVRIKYSDRWFDFRRICSSRRGALAFGMGAGPTPHQQDVWCLLSRLARSPEDHVYCNQPRIRGGEFGRKPNRNGLYRYNNRSNNSSLCENTLMHATSGTLKASLYSFRKILKKTAC